jgi:urease accessory protein
MKRDLISVQDALNLAQLELKFDVFGDKTRLFHNSHSGSIRVQKALYPEGDKVCHAIIVHPPGGYLAGDIIQVNVDLVEHAHVLITTPGASKWYKSANRPSVQSTSISVGPNAAIEWLPQETIFYNAAQANTSHSVRLAKNAKYIGGEILCFGRTASGEQFSTGLLKQRNTITLDGQLIWYECGVLDATSDAMHSPLVLGGATVCATVIGVAQALTNDMFAHVVDFNNQYALNIAGKIGVTNLKTHCVARYLGHCSEEAKRWLNSYWGVIRPLLMGRAALTPRIWNT